MELKVWVEGIQRIVCGVTEITTCQDVVFALAHATGKSGRFTLIERWRNNERQMAPNENPLKILLKWGEYFNDVQFILQCSDKMYINSNKRAAPGPHSTSSTNITTKSTQMYPESSKSINLNGIHSFATIRGMAYVKSMQLEVRESSPSSLQNSPKQSNYCASDKSESSSQRIAPPYKDPPVPPPYRNPPPPVHNERNKNLPGSNKDDSDNRNKHQEPVMFNTHQYKELISLINFQREKLSNQQSNLTKYDAEIVYWEGREKEKHMQLDYASKELVIVANTTKLNQDKIKSFNYIEKESEILNQQEQTLKSETTLLRSKLSNCETELLQCKNKIRLIMDELQIEQRIKSRQNDSRKLVENSLLAEMDHLQCDIESAKHHTDFHIHTKETLEIEVAALETAIAEKKRQVEILIADMKEANLESLTIVPAEDLRTILEGSNKCSGSTRKIIGSPRQLENAVPTNKNPHGVWV